MSKGKKQLIINLDSDDDDEKTIDYHCDPHSSSRALSPSSSFSLDILLDLYLL